MGTTPASSNKKGGARELKADGPSTLAGGVDPKIKVEPPRQ
jgi:hypothetical protein